MSRREEDAEKDHAAINELQAQIVDTEKLEQTIDDKNNEIYNTKLKHDKAISESEKKLSSLQRELESKQKNIDNLQVRTKDLEKVYEINKVNEERQENQLESTQELDNQLRILQLDLENKTKERNNYLKDNTELEQKNLALQDTLSKEYYRNQDITMENDDIKKRQAELEDNIKRQKNALDSLRHSAFNINDFGKSREMTIGFKTNQSGNNPYANMTTDDLKHSIMSRFIPSNKPSVGFRNIYGASQKNSFAMKPNHVRSNKASFKPPPKAIPKMSKAISKEIQNQVIAEENTEQLKQFEEEEVFEANNLNIDISVPQQSIKPFSRETANFSGPGNTDLSELKDQSVNQPRDVNKDLTLGKEMSMNERITEVEYMEEDDMFDPNDIESVRDKDSSIMLPNYESAKPSISMFQKSSIRMSTQNDHVSFSDQKTPESQFIKRSIATLGVTKKISTIMQLTAQNPEGQVNELEFNIINPVITMNAIENYVKQKDYMNILSEKVIVDKLILHNEDIVNEELFSDSMFILDGRFKRNRIIFIIAEQAIYLFTHTQRFNFKRKVKFLKRIPFAEIKSICLSEKHFTLFAMQLHLGTDVLFESIKRLDLVLYQAFKFREHNQEHPNHMLAMFNACYLKSFNIMMGEKIEQEVKLDKGEKKLYAHLSDTYRNAHRAGYLKKLKKGWFIDEFKEYFFLLTNIGLIYFSKVTDMTPKGFFPILGANISKPYRDKDINDGYVFNISFSEINMNIKIVAASKILADEWVTSIRKVQDAAVNYTSDTKEKEAKKELIKHM